MLKKKLRLKTSEFERVFKDGRYSDYPLFLCKILKGSNIYGYAVSVPAKIAPKASSRNEIKRKVYSAIEDVISESIINSKTAFVFVVKKDILDVDFKLLTDEVSQILSKNA